MTPVEFPYDFASDHDRTTSRDLKSNTTMPTKILVPTDGSKQSYGGVVYALRSFPDGTHTTLYVIDVGREGYEGPWTSDPWEERARQAAEEIQDQAKKWAEQYDSELETETTVGVPHKQILEYVVDHDVDHVIMGSHGRSPITQPFVGHVTEAVARRAPVSLSIVPESADDVEARELPGRILVPVDGSEQATAALEFALSWFPGASITALHVIEVPVDYSRETVEGTYVERQFEDLQNRADELLASTEERAAAHDHEIQTAATHGKPGQAIVEYCSENEFDQIVMGSHGRSGLSRILLGSVAEAVAQQSPIPVTIVRE